MPSPQSSTIQSVRQPSPLTPFPSSHCSSAGVVEVAVVEELTMPSPQISIWQLEEQPSFKAIFPSSQASPDSKTPLPQPSIWQFELHPSPLTRLLSSQVSPHRLCRYRILRSSNNRHCIRRQKKYFRRRKLHRRLKCHRRKFLRYSFLGNRRRQRYFRHHILQ